MHELFVIAAPGLEPLVAEELARLPGAADLAISIGGVTVRGDEELLYRANLVLRCASRVLLRLQQFRARDFATLCRALQKLPLANVMEKGRCVAVRVTAHRSRLYHTGAIAERVLTTLAERGLHDENGAPGPSLFLRVLDDEFTVSIDTSGELLHQRGWRTEGGEAPLRETLAAALLRLSNYAGSDGEPLSDPTCGSGTLVIEGALAACGRVPGLHRRFAFQDWPGYRPQLFAALRREAEQRERPVANQLILASDLSPEAVAVARRNAERAGVAELIRFDCRDVATARLPAGRPGLVLCNPPYGKRIGDGSLRPLYRAIGQYARSAPGWRLSLIGPANGLVLLRAASRQFATLPLDNGGLRVLFCSTEPLPRIVRAEYASRKGSPAQKEAP